MYKKKGLQVPRVSRSADNSQDKAKSKTSSASSSQIASIENLLSSTIQERVRSNANSTSIHQSSNSQSQLKRGMDFSENISPIKKSSTILSRMDFGTKSVGKTYVETVLHNAGMNFIVSQFGQNVSHELRIDQAMFVRSVQLAFCGNKEKVNVELFMEDFSRLHQDNELLVRSLSPTHTVKDCDLARGAIQDSLIRLLLQVDCLHCCMGDYLLDKLGEFTLQDFRDENLTLIEMVGLLLSPLRHMNLTNNSSVLCERMLELISLTSNTAIKQIIITCIPDILNDNDHFTAASELAKMLKNTPELTVAILDTLNNLSLANDLKCGVRRCMITCLQRADINFLPSIIKFLITTSDADSWDEIINGLRSELFTSPNNIISTTQSQSVQRYNQLFSTDGYPTQKAIFDNIREGLLISRKFADAWMKNITLLQMQQSHRPVDVIILLIMHDIANDNGRKRSIENIIKNKIKNGLFVTKILEDAFQAMPTILEQYFSSLMELLSNLLRSPDPTLSEFAFISYRICFEKMTGFWSKNLVKELLGYIGAGDTNNASVALNVLSDITSKFPDKIKPIASILKVLFNKMEDLELSEVQQSMDILCCIAFSEGDEITCGTLQDDLNILIRKQLTSPRIQLLRNGIVGAIMAIIHMTKLKDGQTNISNTQLSKKYLTHKGKRALPFLELLMENTKHNAEARALFFDQFSSALLHCEHMDNSFKQYLSETIEDLLKEFFLIEWADHVPVDKFECDVMFGLEGNDKQQVVLNLIPQLMEDRRIDNKPQLPVIVLHSLFRLIRVIHSENLESVNALLGCPIVFPTPNTLDQFSSLAIDEQVIVMDALFHCINWFREIINSFAYLIQQNEPKVLIRLRSIIWLQTWIAKCLPQMFIPDYCPPKCYFHVASKAPVLAIEKKRKRNEGKKAQKDADTSTCAVINDPSIIPEDCAKEKGKNTANVKAYKSYFRSMDIDVWIMLTTPLTLNPQPCKDGSVFSAELGPSELLFLLEEFVGRLQYTLPSTIKKGNLKSTATDASSIMSSRLYMTSPEFVVKYVIKLLPSIMMHLDKISKYTKALLKANDNVFDSPGMYTLESKQLNSCLELILKGLVIFFNWSPFRISCNQEQLLDALRVIASKGSKSQSKEKYYMKSVVRDCIQFMGEYENSVLHLEAAVNLVSLLHIFWKLGEDGNSREKIGEICKQFLSHRWFNLDGSEDKGSSYNKNIEILLSIYMQGPNKLELLQNTVLWLEDEIDEFSKTEKVLRTFPTFNKGNFSIIIRVICVTLELVLKEASGDKTSDHDRLNVWMSITGILKSVVSILKKQDNRMNLIAFLKGSIPILQSFLNHGLAVCSTFLREKHSDVILIVKGMQITTRCIQQICNYTKKTKDSTLNAHLPRIRSLLEAIVWRVKRMTVVNNCKDAFFMGLMKNKDIHGNNMTSSQSEEMESEEVEAGLLNIEDNQEEEPDTDPTTDILSAIDDSPPRDGDISDGESTEVCGEEDDVSSLYMEDSD